MPAAEDDRQRGGIIGFTSPAQASSTDSVMIPTFPRRFGVATQR